MIQTESSWRPTPADRAQGAWQLLQIHLTGRLAYLRLLLENPAVPDDEARVLRGQIKEVKRLQDLDKELPDVQGLTQ